jgi:hypothetical protein
MNEHISLLRWGRLASNPPCSQAESTPPAGGDKEMMGLLDRLL